ncbi:MAG: 5-methylcytosine-specific restriction endonuclease McrA [Oleispira sp.]|jgi:5-methylcytosine-specific restriction endonuclease McrA
MIKLLKQKGRSYTMPRFQGSQGVFVECGYYPGNSYRALVINQALDDRNFIVVNINGVPTPMYQCCQCRKFHTSAGLEGDHMVAQAQGGGGHLGNLQILCTICNRADIHHRGAGPIASRTRGQYAARREDYP